MPAFTLRWNGTGNAFNFARGHTSFTVSSEGVERRLLVDCGATVPLRLLQSEELAPVTDVLLTHLHADHVGGLEGLIFFNYYALGRQFENKLRIHVATDEFAHRLWEHCLKGGMEANVDNDWKPVTTQLEYYVEIHVAETVDIEGLPPARFIESLHVPGLENYGLAIGDNVGYSGDTVETPTRYKGVTWFQDTDFRHPKVPGIHLPYVELCDAVPDRGERAGIYLVHTGGNADPDEVLNDGFAGIVEPGQEFEF